MSHLDVNMSAPDCVLAAHDATARRLPKASDMLFVSTELGPDARLGLWLRALLSFFDAGNHPFTETEQADLTKRDFAPELRIARAVMADCSRLAYQLASAEETEAELFDEEPVALKGLSLAEETSGAQAMAADQSLSRLAESLGHFCLLSEELLRAGAVRFFVWSNVGMMLVREIDYSEAARRLTRSAAQRLGAGLQPHLLTLTQEATLQRALAADLSLIFARLGQMLSWLSQIEAALRRDQPLKQTLPLFTLINQETRHLRRFVENRTLRLEGLEPSISDALDGTNYALAMELRKVFSRELSGLSALRHPPTIYSKVETAHGILRDSFQQSIVALAQLFDNKLDGALLFKAYQNRKEQSLILRQDLWLLLQLIQRAEKERDQHPIVRLLERLSLFQEGSLRYLMYKDWEACERFIEEVGAARGAVELAPVLHRFAAFVETLFNQVSMRAVLADTPFDFPALDY